MKHTKGQWEVKEVKTSCGRAFKIDEAGKDSGHGVIACIYDDSTTLNERPHQEHEANARLIASAPELLEALKTALKMIAYVDCPQNCNEGVIQEGQLEEESIQCQWCGERSLLEQAISKAEVQ